MGRDDERDEMPSVPWDTEIRRLRSILDAARPASREALDNLAKLYDVELTYTSNAIEGNTLTRSETQIVIEKGITIGGKTVHEHLEALDLHKATVAMREMAAMGRSATEGDVVALHRLVAARSRPDIAGSYATVPRRIAGSAVVLPRPEKLPGLMEAFGRDLADASGWRGAAEAHYRLVTIHLFADGNGRTARLLMNMILLRDGYPPVTIGPPERADYIRVIEARQLAEPIGHRTIDASTRASYAGFVAGRVVASLRDHLTHLGIEHSDPGDPGNLGSDPTGTSARGGPDRRRTPWRGNASATRREGPGER